MSPEHSEALLASIFFDAPHVALVSHRIHQLSAGRPRETMALVQHLLNAGRVRYVEGNWVLPGDLAAGDLPASAEDALRLRIAKLAPSRGASSKRKRSRSSLRSPTRTTSRCARRSRRCG